MLLSPSVGKSEREEEEEKFKKRESEKGNPERGAQLFSELGRGARIPFCGTEETFELESNVKSGAFFSFVLLPCLSFSGILLCFLFLSPLPRDGQ